VYGDRAVRIEYSKLSAKHRIRSWVQLLALTAQWPERAWTAVAVGRGTKDDEPVVGSFLHGVSGADAPDLLDDLVRIYRLGMTRPLPVPPKTACAYAEKRRSDMAPANALTYAARKWSSKSGTGATWGEFDDGDHRRVGLVTVEDLVAQPADAVPLPNPGGEPHLFGLLATAVWSPLLAHEALRT
jgi:exodeoxyribonuclease V gamma subunit